MTNYSQRNNKSINIYHYLFLILEESKFLGREEIASQMCHNFLQPAEQSTAKAKFISPNSIYLKQM